MTLLYPQRATTLKGSGSDIGKTVTASATAHTKGSWVELQGALAFDGFFVEVDVWGTFDSNDATATLLDIGVDSAGGTSYDVAIPNIGAGYRDVDGTNTARVLGIAVPLFIPAGSTVAARIQSVNSPATQVAEVAIVIHGGTPASDPFPIQGLIVDYGTDESNSQTIGLTNANADVEGAWKEIVDATTHPHRGLSVGLQGNSSGWSNRSGLLDIGIGATSSEKVLMEDIYFAMSGSEKLMGSFPQSRIIVAPIPEGSRLAARAQTSTNNGQALLGVSLYGWG